MSSFKTSLVYLNISYKHIKKFLRFLWQIKVQTRNLRYETVVVSINIMLMVVKAAYIHKNCLCSLRDVLSLWYFLGKERSFLILYKSTQTQTFQFISHHPTIQPHSNSKVYYMRRLFIRRREIFQILQHEQNWCYLEK